MTKTENNQKKYMITISYGALENRNASSHPDDDAFVMQKYQEWSKKIAGKTVFAHKLKDGEGRRLDFIGSELKDGPYTETKESIGGFYIVRAHDYDEAVEIAKECPSLLYQGGFVDVREVEI